MSDVDQGDTFTFTYDGDNSSDTLDAYEILEAEITIEGPGGGGAYDAESDADSWDGGAGGYARFTVDLTNDDSLTIFAGRGGASATNNYTPWGQYDGGEPDRDDWAGHGGGNSAVLFEDGTLMAAGDAGAGASGVNSVGDSVGGGGGARGGTGAGDGTDGGGTGNGGDANLGATGDGAPGGDGGQEVSSDSRIQTVHATTTGGGGAGGTVANDGSSASNGGHGQVVVEVTDARQTPEAPVNVAATAIDADQIDLTWDEPADQDDYDEYRVYRSTASGVTTSDTLVAQLAPGTTSYSDTGLDDGTTYHYVLTAYIADDGSGSSYESSTSTEVSDTTVLPAPTNFSIDAISTDDADLSWTDNAADESGYRVYQRLTGGSYSEVEDLAADTTTYTATGLLNGREYEWYVEAYTSDATAASSTAIDTTVLPDVDALPLDTSVEDELTAAPETTPSLNHGEWAVEYREDGATSWTSWGTTSYTNDPTITGLLDGQEYDVRVRSQTTDVTGTFYQATAVTLLPAPTNVSTANVTTTSLDLSWTDNADNEARYEVLREREYEDGFGNRELLAELDPNTEAYTDSSVQPDQTYRYTSRVVTSYTTSESTTTTTTDSLNVPQRRTRRSGWTVEIDHPTADVVLTPEVLSDAVEWQPQTNGLPRLRVPVPKRDRWLQDGFPGSVDGVRVWKDGEQLPIDDLVAVEPETARVVLVLEGGQQLKRFIESRSVDEALSHEEADAIITGETDYATNVDDPASQQETDITMLRVSDADPSEFRDKVPLADTDPAQIGANFGLETLQTGWFYSAWDQNEVGHGDILGGGSRQLSSSAEWVDGETVILESAGDGVEAEISPAYALPSNEVQLAFYLANPEGDNPPFDIKFNGSVVESVGEGLLSVDADNEDTRWFTSAVSNSQLTAGNDYTFSLELTGGNGNRIWIDTIWAGDQRWSYDFDATTTNQEIDGPQLYPQSFQAETVDTSSVERVVAGRLDTTWNDVSNGQALAVSNDQGNTWLEQTNLETMDRQEFASAEQQIRGRVTLSRYGSDSGENLPETGFKRQYVESIEVLAELDDTPVLLDKHLKGRVHEVLNEIADSGDFVWELRRDASAATDDPTGMIIEWTQAGQRTRSRTPEAAIDVSGRRTLEGSYERIIVTGTSEPIEDERVTFNEVDSLVGVDNGPVVVGSETVYDPSDGTEFTRGDDYVMQWFDVQGGDSAAIKITSDGNMTTGKEYAIDYRYKYRGEASVDGVSNPRTEEVRVPDAASYRECDQIALAILKRVQDPLETVRLTVATDDPTQPLVEALSHDAIPFDGTFVVRDKSVAPGRITWELGSRQSFSAIIEEIREQFQGVADQL